ncbi:hypothetical protein QBZ16_000908 [Prototheca wickerhamii]|uniref:Peroxisomal membrane protein PEX14 n=1 Tax=Prototheca wickerhamii TaxID=3111 RepID=A0AAD9MKH7_PROWI|nr:hypothetical protein QBZ16_000908 [Prototheca wickerhamii]
MSDGSPSSTTAPAVTIEEIPSTSVPTLREDQIQNAVSFLSHPKVRSSPMDQKRQFLERKGLTEAEIAEAVRRVPAEPAAPAQPSTPPSPPAYYGQAPPAQQQLVPAGPPQPQPVRWSHALLGAAFVAAGAYALKVLLWPYVQDAVAKWRASQHAAEERAAQQAQRTEALAEAIREQTSELRGTVELLQKLTSTLEQTQAAAQRDAEARLRAPESVTLADLRAELRTLATTLRSSNGGAREDEGLRSELDSIKKLLLANGGARAADTAERPQVPASSAGPAHPASYMEVLEMLEKGETPPGIRTDIDDKAPNPEQAVPTPRMPVPRKPEASSRAGEAASQPESASVTQPPASVASSSTDRSPLRGLRSATSIYEAASMPTIAQAGVIAGQLGSAPSSARAEAGTISNVAADASAMDASSPLRGWQAPPLPQASLTL